MPPPLLRRAASVVSILYVAAGYGWLYTSDLFLASNEDPRRAVQAALSLAAIWAAVILLHGLVLPHVGWLRRLPAGTAEAAALEAVETVEAAERPVAPAPAAAPRPAMPPAPLHPNVWWAVRAAGGGAAPLEPAASVDASAPRQLERAG